MQLPISSGLNCNQKSTLGFIIAKNSFTTVIIVTLRILIIFCIIAIECLIYSLVE